MLLQCPELAAIPSVSHAFFTRQGGVSTGIYASLNAGFGSGDSKEHVAENRNRMAAALRVEPAHLITAHQTHSAIAHIVSAPPAAPMTADALVTNTRGLSVGILTADCAPMLLADAKAGVVAAAHAGWKGALGGILEATLAAMESLGAERHNISATVGPCIAQQSYEVGADFFARFANENLDSQAFFQEAGEKYLFDLSAFVLHRLTQSGVEASHVLGVDTYSDEARFYSFRRTTHRGESDYGRQLSAIGLFAK